MKRKDFSGSYPLSFGAAEAAFGQRAGLFRNKCGNTDQPSTYSGHSCYARLEHPLENGFDRREVRVQRGCNKLLNRTGL